MSVDFQALWTGVQRTVVSFVVGFLLTQAARLGWHFNDPALVAMLTVAIGAVWYTVFHYLEMRFKPIWGWFLGKAGSPQYAVIRHDFEAIAPLVAPLLAPALAEVQAALKALEAALAQQTPPVA